MTAAEAENIWVEETSKILSMEGIKTTQIHLRQQWSNLSCGRSLPYLISLASTVTASRMMLENESGFTS